MAYQCYNDYLVKYAALGFEPHDRRAVRKQIIACEGAFRQQTGSELIKEAQEQLRKEFADLAEQKYSWHSNMPILLIWWQ